jgi:hypothetical protein
MARAIPRAMRIATISIASAVVALGIAACGSSNDAPATTSATPLQREARFARQLKAWDEKVKRSPEAAAFEAAAPEWSDGLPLPQLERAIVGYLPKMTAYFRYLRSLHFPACLLSFKRRLMRFTSENQAVFQTAMPLIRNGNEADVRAYFVKASVVLHHRGHDLNQWIEQIEHSGNGNGGC